MERFDEVIVGAGLEPLDDFLLGVERREEDEIDRPVGGTGYACGKAGLMELTRILVAELAMANSSVLVFNAGPGLVNTEMTRLQTSEAGLKWIPSTKETMTSGTQNSSKKGGALSPE